MKLKLPDELKLAIYDFCQDMPTRLSLNKAFRWSFFIRNPLQNAFYKRQPIKINVTCNGFDNFTTNCPFCNKSTRIKLYPGNIGNPVIICRGCDAKAFLESLGDNRYSVDAEFELNVLLVEAKIINSCNCYFDCTCESVSIRPVYNINTYNLKLDYEKFLFFKARNHATGNSLTVFWSNDLFIN